MKDIINIHTFAQIMPIKKGWSDDKKYYIVSTSGEKFLLRIAEIIQYQRKKAEYEIMQKLATLDILVPKPIDFGVCNNGESVYMLLTWCIGEDAEVILPKMSEEQQYWLGLSSGKILKQIHSLPMLEKQEEWGARYNRKTDYKIEKYRNCGIKLKDEDKIIAYIEQNRHLLYGRPQCLQHGDYHVGNMVISASNILSIIDFNRFDYGDPWEEFNRIVWSATISPHFATGQLNGYFDGKPPLKFFKLLALYIASNTLSSIYWAIPFGETEIHTMVNHAYQVLSWYDNMKNPIPSWYVNTIIQ